jgi:uncharacterized membrane protein
MSKENKINKAEKRKMEQLRRRKRNMKYMSAISFILIAVIAIVIVASMSSNPNVDIKSDEPTKVSEDISDTEISIPVADIESDAQFYSYDADGVEVRYFAVIGSDGDVHVALDACDVCYHAKKGYRQVEEVMQCINCGLEFPTNSIGTDNTAGGCWPSYIPIKIDGDNVIIQKSDLAAKSYMF